MRWGAGMKSQAKQVGWLFLGMFGVMLVVRFTAYSQQPFWDILIGWNHIMWLDLIPIEGFNTDADGYPIETELRERICVVVNFAIMAAGFWFASGVKRPKRRRIAQTSVFTVFLVWYAFMVFASMMAGAW